MSVRGRHIAILHPISLPWHTDEDEIETGISFLGNHMYQVGKLLYLKDLRTRANEKRTSQDGSGNGTWMNA